MSRNDTTNNLIYVLEYFLWLAPHVWISLYSTQSVTGSLCVSYFAVNENLHCTDTWKNDEKPVWNVRPIWTVEVENILTKKDAIFLIIKLTNALTVDLFRVWLIFRYIFRPRISVVILKPIWVNCFRKLRHCAQKGKKNRGRKERSVVR